MSIKRALAVTAGLMILALGAHPAAAATNLVEDCSDDGYVLRIKDITFTPPFPEPGKQFHWQLKGTLREPINLHESTAEVNVRLGSTTLVAAQTSVHDLLAYGGANPPDTLGKGRVSLSGTVQLPADIPPGDYRMSLRAWDEDAQNLACLKARLNMRAA